MYVDGVGLFSSCGCVTQEYSPVSQPQESVKQQQDHSSSQCHQKHGNLYVKAPAGHLYRSRSAAGPGGLRCLQGALHSPLGMNKGLDQDRLNSVLLDFMSEISSVRLGRDLQRGSAGDLVTNLHDRQFGPVGRRD